MLKSILNRSVAIPAISIVVFGSVILFARERAPVEAGPAPSAATIGVAAAPARAGLPEDDEDIVDYSFVYPLKTSSKTYETAAQGNR